MLIIGETIDLRACENSWYYFLYLFRVNLKLLQKIKFIKFLRYMHHKVAWFKGV